MKFLTFFKSKNLANASNILTFMRIFAVPFVSLMLILSKDLIAFCIFCFAAISDYFDGYFARLFKTESKFGAFLDPMADKLLVTNTLLILTYRGIFGGLFIICVAIIIFREILVSDFRNAINFPVSSLGKWKTALQMLGISCILCGMSVFEIANNSYILWIIDVGLYILCVSSVNSFISCVQYIRYCFDSEEI